MHDRSIYLCLQLIWQEKKSNIFSSCPVFSKSRVSNLTIGRHFGIVRKSRWHKKEDSQLRFALRRNVSLGRCHSIETNEYGLINAEISKHQFWNTENTRQCVFFVRERYFIGINYLHMYYTYGWDTRIKFLLMFIFLLRQSHLCSLPRV